MSAIGHGDETSVAGSFDLTTPPVPVADTLEGMGAIRVTEDSAVECAERLAAGAARHASVSIRALTEADEVNELGRLLTEIWQADGPEPLMTQVMTRALIHSGNYVSGAFSQHGLVGASVGFYGADGRRLFLHSHITGVASSMQGRSVGFALKQHQRGWALRRQLDSITWTFDPLVRRNGYFNVTKLGAEIVDYRQNFYGPMHDGINGEDASDRCVVHWTLDSDRARAAAEGRLAAPLVDSAKASVILAASVDEQPEVSLEPGSLLIATVPRDIVRIRRSDAVKAAAWRAALRDACLWAFGEGYSITGMTREGSYVFTPPS